MEVSENQGFLVLECFGDPVTRELIPRHPHLGPPDFGKRPCTDSRETFLRSQSEGAIWVPRLVPFLEDELQGLGFRS